MKYEDGNQEDLELHMPRDILLKDGDIVRELNGRKQTMEKK